MILSEVLVSDEFECLLHQLRECHKQEIQLQQTHPKLKVSAESASAVVGPSPHLAVSQQLPILEVPEEIPPEPSQEFPAAIMVEDVVETAADEVAPAEDSDLGVHGRQKSMSRVSFHVLDGFSPTTPQTDKDPDASICRKIKTMLSSDSYEFVLAALVLSNVFIMAFELQYEGYRTGNALEFTRMSTPPSVSWPYADDVFATVNTIFVFVFTVDIVIRIVFLQLDFFRVLANWLDLIVVAGGLINFFTSDFAVNAVFLRLLRLAKLLRPLRVARVVKVLESLHLLLKCVRSSVEVLFWSLCLLGVIQCIAGMIIMQTLTPYMQDDSIDLTRRSEVFRYYGTYSYTLLTMSEVLFANWAPSCRVLVDNVSDLYIAVFIIYRCLVGFAILNVVGAVFIQQTMKVAQADHDYMMTSKQKQVANYCKKLKTFFRQLDTSGDGLLSWDEFSAVLEKPDLLTWMSTLELEPHDLVDLFHMIDDGDGEISVDEFLEGAVRLRGSARSIDVAQLLASTRKLDAKIEAVLNGVAYLSGDDARRMRRSATIGQRSSQLSSQCQPTPRSLQHIESPSSP
eukprot:TRINITY_DN41488_c0_g1_i1.p1 TRINITY_DN41488_c0_g1~~TRINITY_DN41488_c0_g1_i1.p1  ORF type:complete len:568 (-),score=77.90 TRINITY_DN41488_c0_g1_i1:168-1871(-)